MIQDLFTILENGKIKGDEEMRTFLRYADEDAFGFEERLSFNQFHLPGWCEIMNFGDGRILFFNEFGKSVSSFAEATKDVCLDILEENKDWIVEQIENGIYEVEHEHMLSYEFYLKESTKEIVVIECWGDDSYKNTDGLIWLYRLEACFRDWEDYVTNSDEITANDIYNEMCTNADKLNHLKKGVYVTSSGKWGNMKEKNI